MGAGRRDDSSAPQAAWVSFRTPTLPVEPRSALNQLYNIHYLSHWPCRRSRGTGGRVSEVVAVALGLVGVVGGGKAGVWVAAGCDGVDRTGSGDTGGG